MLKLRRRIDHPVLELPAGTTHSEEEWKEILGVELSQIDKDFWFEPSIVQVHKLDNPNDYIVTVKTEKNIVNFSNAFKAALSDVVAEMNSALNNCPEE